MYRLLFVFILLVLPSTLMAEPGKPKIELKGSIEIETFLNKRAKELGMVRVKNDAELKHLIEVGYLVPIPEEICVDTRLEKKWRYVMPQVARFLLEFQAMLSEQFGEACYVVNSAVRTKEKQIEIRAGSGTSKNGNNEENTNAAAAKGPVASLHLTGSTIDIGKLDPVWRRKSKLVQLSPKMIKWMRENLLKFEDGVSFNVTEEFGQAVFHITVLPKEKVSVD